MATGVPKFASISSITSRSVVRKLSATLGDTLNITSLAPTNSFDIVLACSSISKHIVCADLTIPAPEQYGHDVQRVLSSDCFTRLRVIATRPKSLIERILDGARSRDSSCC